MAGGRHADPDRAAFWRSLGSAAAKALLALAVVVGLTALAVLWSTRDDALTVATPTPPPTPTPTPAAATPLPEPDEAPTVPVVTPTPEPTPTPSPTPTPAPTPPGREPAQVTVQVLDGGVGPGRVQDVVATVEGFGYRVVAINVARCCYEATTVFYTSGEQEQAEGLRARDPRFGVVDANPNLSEEVDIHVVVGEDWNGG